MLENNARYFILTNKNENLQQYNQTQQKIDSLINTLQSLPYKSTEEKTLSDSIRFFAQSKPSPQLVFQAAKELNLNLQRFIQSWEK